MTIHAITRDEVVERGKALPGFPPVINQILETLDNPEANMNMLAKYIKHDPVVAAIILKFANAASKRRQSVSDICDVYTASSLIGLNQVRKIVLSSSIADFIGKNPPDKTPPAFYQHSIAVSVCAEELAHHTFQTELSEAALIAGLLHDVGQLWLNDFKTEPFREIWAQADARDIRIEDAEREYFGVDHATIGYWLAEDWLLPAGIGKAIRYHHYPDFGPTEPLAAIVHVAEVLSNALELASRNKNRVATISARACRTLGLKWNDDARQLFGKIEARSRYANLLSTG